MQRYVAFLRGLNLGKRRLPMSRLQALFQELGFKEVKTFIASGNVLFSAKTTEARSLETRIAKHLEKALGYDVDTFIRTLDEVIAIGESKVFPEEGRDSITIHVSFLREKLPNDIARQLAGVCTEHDEFHVADREFFWLCRIKSNESKVWASAAIKTLKLPTSTMRNLTSIRKLIAQHSQQPS